MKILGLTGGSGTGKSTAMRSLCRQYLRRSVGLVLACDKGGASKFQGQTRVDVSDLAARPMASEPRSVVFVGDHVDGLDAVKILGQFGDALLGVIADGVGDLFVGAGDGGVFHGRLLGWFLPRYVAVAF